MKSKINSNKSYFLFSFMIFLLTLSIRAENEIVKKRFPVLDNAFKCLEIKISSVDDSYKINPILRQKYYSFISPSDFTIKFHDDSSFFKTNKESEINNFVSKSRFFSYINNVLKKNRKLILTTKRMIQLLNSNTTLSNNLPLINYCKKIGRITRKLDSDLRLIIPSTLNKGLRKNNSYYFKLARKRYFRALFILLIIRINSFERKFCNLLFPEQYTINVEELVSSATPRYELMDIKSIAEAISKYLPHKRTF